MTGALDERIALLDEAGIDMQIVSASNPVFRFFGEAEAIGAVCTASNGELSAAWQRHPGRYRFFATLPLPHVPPSVDELHRAMRLPGCVGVIMYTNFGRPLNDPALDDLYREMAGLRALLFIHPCQMDNPGRYSALGAETMLAWPAEDTLAVMEMVLGGVLDRFSEITVVTPHCSGTALFLMGRIDHGYERLSPTRRQAAHPPSHYFKAMYHDSVTNWRPALDLARAAVGADHMVLGSDFPFWSRHRLGECLDVVNGLEWPEEELALLRGGNVARLLRERSRLD